MSYILEALKKAQAERQLGNAPTIHAPAPAYAPSGAAGGARRHLALGLGAGVLIAAGVLLWVRQADRQPAPAGTAPAVAAQAPGAAPAPIPAPAAPAPAPSDPAPAGAGSAPAAARPVPAAPAIERAPAAAPKPAVPEPPPASSTPPSAPAPAPAAAEPARAAAPEAVPDEGLPTLVQLPEAVQRDIPRVAFGGYIYSPNPAERLLLVDKTLRREGEEVAPGLVLERLLPKAAVMNYRGTRYRVVY